MAKKKYLEKKVEHKGGFLGLPRHVFESSAYRQLSLKARCLLDEFQNIFRRDGRNGRLRMPVEYTMERLNISSYTTAQKAFQELQDMGFIDLCLDSDYSKGKAREWRLTYETCKGREPTNDFMRFESVKLDLPNNQK